MAILVEDGTGLSNAQCYCSVAYLDAWMAERGYTTTALTATKEAALVVAAKDWIDGQHTFVDEKLDEDQALEFPRLDEEIGLPAKILQANAQAAYLHLNGLLLVSLSSLSVTGQVESESKSVGTLSKSTTYARGTSQTYSRVLPSDLIRLLQPYLLSGQQSVYRL